jgi:DNA/RNA endonuclease G (NUC1)
MSKSFLLSNISPQKTDSISGIWNKLFELVRKFAFTEGRISFHLSHSISFILSTQNAPKDINNGIQ